MGIQSPVAKRMKCKALGKKVNGLHYAHLINPFITRAKLRCTALQLLHILALRNPLLL